MLIDYHIHSTFSNDSIAKLDDIFQNAIAQDITEVAITDHIDFQYPVQPPNYTISDLDLYFKSLRHYQQKYDGQLTIKIGVEVGLNEHRIDDYQRILNHYPFDFVIASLHCIQGLEPHEETYYQGKTKESAYIMYYQEIDRLLDTFDNFNILGHLDYVKRYMPYAYLPKDHLIGNDIVTNVLKKIIAMGKGIEINTSGFKHISNMGMPHFDIVSQYHQLGGTTLTLGSDSHDAQFVGYEIANTMAQLKQLGIHQVSTFTQRQEKMIAI